MKLEFPENSCGENEGLGDAGVETYKDTPFASLARECGQNSNDAAIGRPVKLRFRLFEIDNAELPDIASLRKSIDACLKKAHDLKIEKEIEFFQRAENTLSSDKIRVMEVADFNTKGLRGPCEEGTPFHSLVKSTGVSVDKGDDSGGSYGIGKHAAFASSDLQTVFYSTRYMEGAKEQFLALGKCILTSHIDSEGRKRRAKGYFGETEFQPVTDESKVPHWLRRKGIGTSVYVVGFADNKDWSKRLIASVLRNFFIGIHDNEIEFEVVSDVSDTRVDRTTVQQLFNDPSIEEAARDSSILEDFLFARHLCRSLTSDHSKETVCSIPSLGDVSIRVLVEEDLPKRVCIARNGMFIADNLEHFNDKLQRFTSMSDFVALVQPLDVEGRSLLKKLENPRHDSFSSARIPNDLDRNAAKKAIQELVKVVRNTIRLETYSPPDDQVELDELSELFSDFIDDDRLPEPSNEEDIETIKIETTTTKKPPKKQVLELTDLESGEDGGGGSGGGGEGTGSGSGNNDGHGDGGTGTRKQVAAIGLHNVRSVGSVSDSSRRTIWFTSEVDAEATMIVLASGIEGAERIPVLKTSLGTLNSKGQLEIKVEKDKRKKLELDFAAPYLGPIELTAYTLSGESK